ncbi:MAG: carbohydrate ABC transporter permease [Chloroflexi bacterium]|nr:MAG: glycerol-3-phosphate ABC transporter permease [Phototrophicales bacterium]RMF80144.1 MAG: carbohydrate ABC transporter permease [Chloroflexota bacterium]
MPQPQRKRDWSVPLTHVTLIVIIFIMALPLLYALLLATFTQAQAFTYPPRLVPGGDLVSNINILFNRNFGTQILNTVFIAVIVVVAKTVLSLLAGLAFVYFRFPGKWFLFFFVLLTLLMPTEIIIVPLFNLVADLGWGDTFFALTVPFFASATGSFLFRQHFSNIPGELAEAAQLDGATPLRFLWSVLVPMSWNVIGAMAVIQFIYMWNQYLWPVIIMNSPEKKVIQQGVRDALQVGAQTDFGPVMAGAIIATIPPLVVFILLQKQFMSGFALTRDK